MAACKDVEDARRGGDPYGRRRSEWRPERAAVVQQVRRGADWYKLTLRAPYIAARATAGQFVECAVHPAGFPGADPLLNRPFSICEIIPDEGLITLIYRAGPGRGTRALARLTEGQELDLLGPLGYSFPDPGRSPGTLVLVGGGIGLPPMVAAAEWALAAGRPVHAIAGARSAGGLAGLEELRATGARVTVVTDDGSAGQQGFVTLPLAEAIEQHDCAEVWACGPEGMLQAVKALCERRSIPCFLALERYMGCGFGVCMSCTIPKAGGAGYWKCCVDGPVFPAGEVLLGD